MTVGFGDWAATRDTVRQYRDSGCQGPVTVRAMNVREDTPEPERTFLEAAPVEADRARALGIDEIHWDLNLAGVAPEAQLAAYEKLLDRRRG
ncbi:hypothetical protein ACTWQF_04525 [Streptomyces sp. 8N114]|uniref:hypothetical protein n=1 Tax=Streptomyces sp. 8N114 TaxID=3457419 RepID=UPI003FD635FA